MADKYEIAMKKLDEEIKMAHNLWLISKANTECEEKTKQFKREYYQLLRIRERLRIIDD